MSLKHFHINERLINVNENHVQYVHNKTFDPPRVTQYTVLELSYGKHKNWKKNL